MARVRCVYWRLTRRTVRLILLVFNALANQTAAAQKLSLQSVLDVNALFVVGRGFDGSGRSFAGIWRTRSPNFKTLRRFPLCFARKFDQRLPLDGVFVPKNKALR